MQTHVTVMGMVRLCLCVLLCFVCLSLADNALTPGTQETPPQHIVSARVQADPVMAVKADLSAKLAKVGAQFDSATVALQKTGAAHPDGVEAVKGDTQGVKGAVKTDLQGKLAKAKGGLKLIGAGVSTMAASSTQHAVNVELFRDSECLIPVENSASMIAVKTGESASCYNLAYGHVTKAVTVACPVANEVRLTLWTTPCARSPVDGSLGPAPDAGNTQVNVVNECIKVSDGEYIKSGGCSIPKGMEETDGVGTVNVVATLVMTVMVTVMLL